MKRVKNILKELIEINTETPIGNESKACEYLANLFKNKAKKIEMIGIKPRENIIAYFGNLKSSKVLLITGHLDVAPTNLEKWDTDPYKICEKGDKIFGRGSCDMKGGLSIGIEAILRSVEENLLEDKLIIFAGTADEETGACSQIGAKIVVDYLKEKKIKPIGVILPEPNNDYEILKVNIGHRGMMALECESAGKAMHPGSSVHKENNAVINMFNFIEELNKIIPRNPFNNNEIPGSSCRITYINAGFENQYKSIPDKCICNLDVRVSPIENNENILKLITKLGEEKGIKISCVRRTDPSIINKDELIVKKLVKILEEENQKYEITCASPVCDAHWFNSAGFPTINTLGASGGMVHAHNEYAIINSFEKRVNILLKLISEF